MEDSKKNKYKYQNEWIKQNYERQTITFPKGTKERIKQERGESVNGYINRLVAEDLAKN